MSKIKSIAFAAAAIVTAIGAGYTYMEKRKAKNVKGVDTAKEFNLAGDDNISGSPNVPQDNTLNDLFASIKTTVPFDKTWKNSTGYFNGIKDEVFAVPSGTVLKCIDDKWRKMFIITQEDNKHTVFFQRYSDRSDIVCVHVLDNKGFYSGHKTEMSVLVAAVAAPAEARALVNAAE